MRSTATLKKMYSGHIVMKAFNGEERSIARIQRNNQRLYESAWKSQFLSGMMQPLTTLIGNLGYVGVCILGGWLTIKGAIEIGDIQAFIQYVRNFNQPINQLSQSMNVLQSTAAAAERVFEFLNEEEEIAETTSPVPVRDRHGQSLIQGQVTFETFISAITRIRSSSMISRCSSTPASALRSLGRPARARRRLSSC